MDVVNDELKVSADEATSVFEFDTKLTRTEWTIFWRAKYESLIKRIVEARDIIKQQSTVISRLRAENAELLKRIDSTSSVKLS